MCFFCKGFYYRKIINRYKKRCVFVEGIIDYFVIYNIKLVSQLNFLYFYVEEILNCF